MIDKLISFVCGCFCGGFIGIFTMAMAAMSSKRDDWKGGDD